MPYIKKDRRDFVESYVLADLKAVSLLSAGELNYVLTRIVDTWAKPLTYDKIATVDGVLSDVKSEFYRRVAVPYEDKKIRENGDVYQS